MLPPSPRTGPRRHERGGTGGIRELCVGETGRYKNSRERAHVKGKERTVWDLSGHLGSGRLSPTPRGPTKTAFGC